MYKTENRIVIDGLRIVSGETKRREYLRNKGLICLLEIR